MTSCALCRHALHDAVVVSEVARYGRPSRRVACPACGHVQVSPQPSPIELAEFYRSHAYREEHGQVALTFTEGGERRSVRPNEPRYAEIHARMGVGRAETAAEILRAGYEVLGKEQPEAESLSVLDVGCGPGHVLDGWRKLGAARTVGIELDEPEARKAAEAGHEVHACSLDDYVGDGGFSVVVSHHVLEHLADPVAALRTMKGLLAPGGALVIEVPNLLNPSGLLDENHFQWVHLHDFWPWTLADAFLRAGLFCQYHEHAGTVWAGGWPRAEVDSVPHDAGRMVAAFLDLYRMATRRAA